MVEVSPTDSASGAGAAEPVARSLHLFWLISEARDAHVFISTKVRGRAALFEQGDMGYVVGVVTQGSLDGKEIFCVEVSE